MDAEGRGFVPVEVGLRQQGLRRVISRKPGGLPEKSVVASGSRRVGAYQGPRLDPSRSARIPSGGATTRPDEEFEKLCGDAADEITPLV